MWFDYEWKDMPEIEGEEEDKRRSRGSFYAILKKGRRPWGFLQ